MVNSNITVLTFQITGLSTPKKKFFLTTLVVVLLVLWLKEETEAWEV